MQLRRLTNPVSRCSIQQLQHWAALGADASGQRRPGSRHLASRLWQQRNAAPLPKLCLCTAAAWPRLPAKSDVSKRVCLRTCWQPPASGCLLAGAAADGTTSLPAALDRAVGVRLSLQRWRLQCAGRGAPDHVSAWLPEAVLSIRPPSCSWRGGSQSAAAGLLALPAAVLAIMHQMAVATPCCCTKMNIVLLPQDASVSNMGPGYRQNLS